MKGKTPSQENLPTAEAISNLYNLIFCPPQVQVCTPPTADQISKLYDMLFKEEKKEAEEEYDPTFFWKGMITEQDQKKVIDVIYDNPIDKLTVDMVFYKSNAKRRPSVENFIKRILCKRFQNIDKNIALQDIK